MALIDRALQNLPDVGLWVASPRGVHAEQDSRRDAGDGDITQHELLNGVVKVMERGFIEPFPPNGSAVGGSSMWSSISILLPWPWKPKMWLSRKRICT